MLLVTLLLLGSAALSGATSPPQVCTGPTPRCGNRCGPWGYKINPETYCPTCQCDCPQYKCAPCQFGYKLDPFSCSTCECADFPGCPQVLCERNCVQGFVVNEQGCPTCQCQGNRDGQCPLSIPESCEYNCNTDKSCPGMKKCCYGDCGSFCLRQRDEPVEKPGTCPRRKVLQCLRVDNKCDDDSDCPRKKKCCQDHCGRSCLRPKKNKPPKTCPPRFQHLSNGCRSTRQNRCDSADDCRGKRICCGCPKRCVRP